MREREREERKRVREREGDIKREVPKRIPAC